MSWPARLTGVRLVKRGGYWGWEATFPTGTVVGRGNFTTWKRAMDDADFHLRHMSDPEITGT